MSHSFRNASVLITGGVGFIGSNLAHRLVELGADVTVLDSLIPEYGGNLFNIADLADRVRVNISDVRDAHSMKHLVQDKDYLFNLAGQSSHMDSMRDPYTDLEINCTAQVSILEACRQHNPGVRIVFASTRQIYGRPDYTPVDEAHSLKPLDVNGVNKMAGERYHLVYNDAFDLWACSLRLTNTYGPRMRIKDARQTFLGIWIRCLLEGRPFEVWGGDQLRDLSYVDDTVEALLLAVASNAARGQVFNVGAEKAVPLMELAKLLVELEATGTYTVREFPVDRRRIDIGDYYADDSLIRSTLGWEPTVTLREGLARTLTFYREHLAHYV